MPLESLGHFAGFQNHDCVDVRLGPFVVYYVMGFPTAFRYQDDRLVVCRTHKEMEDFKKDARKIPGVRFGTEVPTDEFQRRWDEVSDPHLYPKVVGKLKRNWDNFDPKMPLNILADWFQDHGFDRAATALRAGHDAGI